jgi:nitrogen fixation NifU-like protein
MAYSDKVIDHYENPRNVGSFDKVDPNVGTGLVGAPACGDVMKLQLRIDDDGIIKDAKFKTFGCGSAIASSSLVTEWVKGKSVDHAEKITNADIAEELSLPPVKIHCSVLAEDAVKAAIYDYKLKKGLVAPTDVYAHDLSRARAHRAEGETDEQVERRVRAGVTEYAARTGQTA